MMEKKRNLGVVYDEVIKVVYIQPIQLCSIAAHRQENQKCVIFSKY